MGNKNTFKISVQEFVLNILGCLVGIIIMYFFPSLLLFPISMFVCKIICIFAKSKTFDWGCIILGIVYIIACWVVTISDSINDVGTAGIIVILGLLPETLIMLFVSFFAAKLDD
ncbi:MAG: hypothetical protein IJE01_01515 [Clostridia bacterium]|nr:hypothetical protein [Clostridia bacterium]